MVERALRRPSGPRGRMLLGNTYDYDRDRIGFLRRAQQRYGDVFRFSNDTTVVLHPALIHELFVRSNQEFFTESPVFARRRAAARRLQDAAPATMTARHKGWPGMNQSVAAAHGARLIRCLDQVLDRSAGGEIGVLPMMKDFSALAVADFCFGRDHRTPGIAEAVSAAAGAAARIMGKSVVPPFWLPLPSVCRVHLTDRRLKSLLGRLLADRRTAAALDRPRDLVDVLLAPGRQRLSDEAVLRLLEVVLRASHGVPGATLAWAVYEFARNPGALTKVRAEAEPARAAAAGERVVASDLPYTEALVKELLRAYPPTWLMGRVVAEPTSLGGWDLRPGEQLMFSPYIVHRDPRWWTDPNDVRPERWLPAEQPHARHAYFPFGAGPRICLGNQLGMLQLTLAIARLADRYDIDAVNLEDTAMLPDALLVPGGLRACFLRRH